MLSLLLCLYKWEIPPARIGSSTFAFFSFFFFLDLRQEHYRDCLLAAGKKRVAASSGYRVFGSIQITDVAFFCIFIGLSLVCVCVILFSYFSDFPPDFVILFFEIAVTECFVFGFRSGSSVRNCVSTFCQLDRVTSGQCIFAVVKQVTALDIVCCL